MKTASAPRSAACSGVARSSASATLDAVRTEPERFDRVAEHPSFKDAPAEPHDVGTFGIAELGPSALLPGAISLTVTLLWLLGDFSTENLVILALVLAAFGVAIALKLRKANAVRAMPAERFVAVVVKERFDLYRPFNDRRHNTQHYVVLQARDGLRREFIAPSRVVSKFAIDDIGIAYVKRNVLVDFIRVDV